ncbi:MAG: PD-(D/E)XK nuclease family protein [Bifidobacteriaceae bacterium]|jgi:putative RecB family exonuclease|nr:PD-(D/E)XK nuclease family protein [Bifidobacteriaceae bacterium]
MPSLSPSRANDFLRCPLLFRFRVIDKLPEPPSPAALKGTLVHLVLERLFDLPRGERSQEAALALLPQAYADLQAKDPRLTQMMAGDVDETTWLQEADQLVRAYFALEDPTRLIPESRELLVEVPLESGLTLRGYIDRLEVAPSTGQIRITDYKTGKSPAPQFQGEMLFQLRFYALAIWRLRGEIPAMVQLLFLGNQDVVRQQPTAGDLERTELRILTIWDSVSAMAQRGEFPPVKGPLCGWCAHQALCPLFDGTPPPLPVGAKATLGLA